MLTSHPAAHAGAIHTFSQGMFCCFRCRRKGANDSNTCNRHEYLPAKSCFQKNVQNEAKTKYKTNNSICFWDVAYVFQKQTNSFHISTYMNFIVGAFIILPLYRARQKKETGPRRVRTADLAVNSRTLCRLSHQALAYFPFLISHYIHPASAYTHFSDEHGHCPFPLCCLFPHSCSTVNTLRSSSVVCGTVHFVYGYSAVDPLCVLYRVHSVVPVYVCWYLHVSLAPSQLLLTMVLTEINIKIYVLYIY